MWYFILDKPQHVVVFAEYAIYTNHIKPSPGNPDQRLHAEFQG